MKQDKNQEKLWIAAAVKYIIARISISFFLSTNGHFIMVIRERVKYYFADLDLGGTPLPPFTDFPPKIFLQKGLKRVFFAQKTPDFGPKNRLRIWGVPPSPLYGQNFQWKGGYGFGGTPPPFTDKIRKVVFEGLP